jgi:hypothetical protein
MLHASTKGILVCYTLVNVQFNHVLKVPGGSQNSRVESFLGCESRRGRYHVRYGSTLRLSGRRRSYESVLRYGIPRL